MLIIRNEQNEDIEAISKVTETAFLSLAISNHTEQFIIKALRAANALIISLVADLDGQVAGHVAFSPVAISGGAQDWFGLGPVSVAPEHQKQGIGKALIRKGLSMLKEMGGQGCVLAGDPEYYKRFGFRNIPSMIHEGIPQRFFLALPFYDSHPEGVVIFHDAFRATA